MKIKIEEQNNRTIIVTPISDQLTWNWSHTNLHHIFLSVSAWCVANGQKNIVVDMRKCLGFETEKLFLNQIVSIVSKSASIARILFFFDDVNTVNVFNQRILNQNISAVDNLLDIQTYFDRQIITPTIRRPSIPPIERMHF